MRLVPFPIYLQRTFTDLRYLQIVTTATVTQTCANAAPTFALQVVGGTQYLAAVDGTTGDTATFKTGLTSASVFVLSSAGGLSDFSGSSYSLAASSVNYVEQAYFRTPAQRTARAQAQMPCSINAQNLLTCSYSHESQFRSCVASTNGATPFLALANPSTSFAPYTCTTVTLKVVPLCIPR